VQRTVSTGIPDGGTAMTPPQHHIEFIHFGIHGKNPNFFPPGTTQCVCSYFCFGVTSK